LARSQAEGRSRCPVRRAVLCACVHQTVREYVRQTLREYGRDYPPYGPLGRGSGLGGGHFGGI